MAQATNWVKRLGRPLRRRRVSVIALEDFRGGLEIWMTDEENRVIQCTLTRQEVTALSESMTKYLNKENQ